MQELLALVTVSFKNGCTRMVEFIDELTLPSMHRVLNCFTFVVGSQLPLYVLLHPLHS